MVNRTSSLGLACLVCGLVVALMCAGCGRRQAGRVTFAVGGAPSELDFWAELADEFQAKTGTRVELLRQPTDTDLRRQGLVTALKARKADPDVFLMDVAWLAQFAASGWLEPLDDRLAASDLETGAFFEKVVDLADRYEGRLVALPVYVDGGLLYYRTDLLEEYGYEGPPETWAELVEMSRKVQAGMRQANPGFYGFVWQGAQYEGLVCNWLEVAGSNGGGFLRQGDRFVLDTDQNREATRFMANLIHRYQVSPPNTCTEMKEEEVRRFFQRGNALFERNWPYAWALHQAEDSEVRGKVGIAPLPHFPGGESVSTLGGWHIGIAEYSDAKDAAFDFLEFVLSRDTQKRLALRLGWNPGRRDVYGDEEVLRKMPHLGSLRSVFENLRPRPVLPYYTLISDVLQRRLNAALAGKMDAQEALAVSEKEIQNIVQRYAGE